MVDRYVRCTAQVGRAMGLALGIDGRILWCEQSGVGCEIWVSADQRLMAYCPAGAPPTVALPGGPSARAAAASIRWCSGTGTSWNWRARGFASTCMA